MVIKRYQGIYLKGLVLILSAVLLSSCGFHLRNQHVLPPIFHCIRLESPTPYGDFESTMRRSLTRLGVNVTRTDHAPVTLKILGSALYSDVPTIGGSNQARVYVYYFQVSFTVLNANQQPMIPVRVVATSETLIVNAGTALEATNQLEVIKQQMREEAAHMIINILNSPQASGAPTP